MREQETFDRSVAAGIERIEPSASSIIFVKSIDVTVVVAQHCMYRTGKAVGQHLVDEFPAPLAVDREFGRKGAGYFLQHFLAGAMGMETLEGGHGFVVALEPIECAGEVVVPLDVLRVELGDGGAQIASSVAGAKLGPGILHSTIGRHAARLGQERLGRRAEVVAREAEDAAVAVGAASGADLLTLEELVFKVGLNVRTSPREGEQGENPDQHVERQPRHHSGVGDGNAVAFHLRQ